MSNELHIIGAGGHAKVVIDVARELGYNTFYLYDDAKALIGKEISGCPVVGNTEKLLGLNQGTKVFIAVGNNEIRKHLFERVTEASLNLVTLVAPSAFVSSSSNLGAGVLVAPRAVINAEAFVGAGVIVNTSAIVEHDVRVGAFSHVAPNSVLLGSAEVGDNCLIGASSVVLPQVSLGDKVVLGANTTATKNLVSGVYVGSPARLIQP